MSGRALASSAVGRLARVFGRKIIDARTGECVGKAFVWFWRGRLYLVGLNPSRAVYPSFQTEARTTYWRQKIEFRSHPDPDFPDEHTDAERDPHPPA